jgi:hypothetical protein
MAVRVYPRRSPPNPTILVTPVGVGWLITERMGIGLRGDCASDRERLQRIGRVVCSHPGLSLGEQTRSRQTPLIVPQVGFLHNILCSAHARAAPKSVIGAETGLPHRYRYPGLWCPNNTPVVVEGCVAAA